MSKLLRAIALGTLLLSTFAHAQAPAPAIEILSKDDARAMFSMSKRDWVANVNQAVAQGTATPMGTSETGLGMAMNTPEGDLLMVRPGYEESELSPSFIQVTVGYRQPRSDLLTDSALTDVIRAAETQMKPEYNVIGNIERYEQGVAVFFVITKASNN